MKTRLTWWRPYGRFSLLVLLLSFCGGCIPIPWTKPHKVLGRGTPISAESARLVIPGQTTRPEVVSLFGTNYVAINHDRSIAYEWDTPGIEFEMHMFLIVPNFGGWDEEAGEPSTSSWRAYFVAFDEQGFVRAAQLKKLSMNKSVSDQLQRWEARLPSRRRETRSKAAPASR